MGSLALDGTIVLTAPLLPSLAVHEGGVLFDLVLKFVAIGPAVRSSCVAARRGRRSTSPPAVRNDLASNHLSVADSIFMPM